MGIFSQPQMSYPPPPVLGSNTGTSTGMPWNSESSNLTWATGSQTPGEVKRRMAAAGTTVDVATPAVGGRTGGAT